MFSITMVITFCIHIQILLVLEGGWHNFDFLNLHDLDVILNYVVI